MTISINNGKIITSCEVCDKEASFGFNVNLRMAISYLEKGYKIQGMRNLGQWYCKEHKNLVS